MQPKTKLQKQVASLRGKLSELSEKQLAWACKYAVDHWGFRTKKSIICTDCGNSFPDEKKLPDGEIDICPHCGANLKIKTCRKRNDHQVTYFSIVTRVKGFQVIRYFYLDKFCKFRRKAYYFSQEVVQRWLLPDGRFVTLARPLVAFPGYRTDIWNHGADLEIRPRNSQYYNISEEAIYPVRRYIPEIKRNGFRGKFYDASAFDLLRLILSDSKAETLLKANQHRALSYMANGHYYEIEKLWPSIKICMRRSFIIKDFSIWKDYCYLLEYFKKDLRNAKYVCPENLHKEHDFWVNKKREIERKEREAWEREEEIRRRQREEERRKREEKAIVQYRVDKANFLGLVFSDDLLQIKVLQNIQEFKEEGEEMHHCVYTNEYYNKANSLILSARIGEQRVATIEVSLQNFTVVQCYGKHNQLPAHYERIMQLLRDNMRLIKRAKSQKHLKKQSNKVSA